MNELTSKYHQLSKDEQQEVQEFIDFLLNKKSHEHHSSHSGYREQLLKVSKWKDEDLKVLEQNKKFFNNWNVAEW